MTGEDPGIETEADFADALRALIHRAHDGGVGVKGGWECRTDGRAPDWDVVVSEVKKPERTGSPASAGDAEAVDD